MKAIAAAEVTAVTCVQKRPDRGRAATAPIARRPDGRVAAARAQAWKQLVKTPKGKLATTRRAPRRSDDCDRGRDKSIDEPAALPQEVRARRIGRGRDSARWLNLGGPDNSHWVDSDDRVVCAEISCYSDRRKADEGAGCPDKIRELFRAVRVAREARTSKLDRPNL
jgi:hypothetical protein